MKMTKKGLGQFLSARGSENKRLGSSVSSRGLQERVIGPLLFFRSEGSAEF